VIERTEDDVLEHADDVLEHADDVIERADDVITITRQRLNNFY